MALAASRKVERVSEKELVEGDTQQTRKVRPLPVREGSSSLVNLESLKGICCDYSESLLITFDS